MRYPECEMTLTLGTTELKSKVETPHKRCLVGNGFPATEDDQPVINAH